MLAVERRRQRRAAAHGIADVGDHATRLLVLGQVQQDAQRAVQRLARAQQRGQLLGELHQAVAAERRVQDSLRGWEARAGNTGSYGGGRLTMPVQGWKTSDFGNRYDPYYRVWQLHAGTDFAAGSGTPIRAAASGRVIRAGWNGGYGRMVEVDHGGGLTTRYAHLSKVLVGVGDKVEAGDELGETGSSGRSTGPHLHYEVRRNGEAVNPVPFIKVGNAIKRYLTAS